MPSKDSPKKSPHNESTKDAFAAPQVGENQHQLETKETLPVPQVEQISSDTVSSVVEPTRTSIEEPVSQPTEPQAEKLPKQWQWQMHNLNQLPQQCQILIQLKWNQS
ncbi:hypothetical protein LB505_010965 [Fusarium chuoi]|nr:hypothetical protein LB505_010965 [Fusarium chuoi]